MAEGAYDSEARAEGDGAVLNLSVSANLDIKPKSFSETCVGITNQIYGRKEKDDN